MEVGRVAQPAAGGVLVAHPAEAVRSAVALLRFFGRSQAGFSLFHKSATTMATRRGCVQESPYWNPRHETMPRDQIEALQVRKLKNLVAWTEGRVPWQAKRLKAAGVTAESIKTLQDLQRIPMMTRDEWMQAQLEDPPFGPLLAAPQEAAIRYHLTSGTTGRIPLQVLDSMKDWEWIAEMWCYGLWGFGVRPADIVFFAFSYGTFVGFWGAHYASEKIGCLVLPGGNMTTEARVKQILSMKATVVCSTPTYALRMAQEAKTTGVDLAGSPVKRLILSGEPAGTIMIFECAQQPGGTHIIEDHYIEEVIDPATGDPVGYGELGERLITSFGRGMIPVLRYRTRDLVVRVPASACSCGRTFDLYDGGIRGRVDDMKLVRGTNVYPRAVESIVREFPEIDEFQIHLYTEEGIRDEIEVLVEIPAAGDAVRVLRDLGRKLAEAHENLR